MKTQKAIREILNQNGIHNGFNLCEAGDGRIFISYFSRDARACMSSNWSVCGIKESTNPKAAWYDYGRKTFLGNMRDGSVSEAIKWATEQYNITEWKKDPFGDYQDAKVLERVYKRFNI